MNDLTIIGNLTNNPSSRIVNTQSGQQTVCDFTVAVNRVVRGQKITDYFRVSCWNKQAENAMKYLTKGSKVAVKGAVTARAYAGNDGTPRASLEVIPDKIEYLSAKQSTDGGQEVPPAPEDGFIPVNDEELPF